jgi:hypothetical protein
MTWLPLTGIVVVAALNTLLSIAVEALRVAPEGLQGPLLLGTADI